MKLIENVPAFYTDTLYEFMARKLPREYHIFKPYGYRRYIIRFPFEIKRKKVASIYHLKVDYVDYAEVEVIADINIGNHKYSIRANPELKDSLVNIITEFENMGDVRIDKREVDLMIIDNFSFYREFLATTLQHNDAWSGESA